MDVDAGLNNEQAAAQPETDGHFNEQVWNDEQHGVYVPMDSVTEIPVGATVSSPEPVETAAPAVIAEASAADPAPAVNAEAIAVDPAPTVIAEASAVDPAPAVIAEASVVDPAPAVNAEASVVDPAPAVNAEASAADPAPAVNAEASATHPGVFEETQHVTAEGDGEQLQQQPNGVHVDTIEPAVPAAPEQPANPLLDKYNNLWAVLKDKPDDFNTWTTLITTAEKLDGIDKIREVFNSFFVEYPLCYGYWKKFADAEARHSSGEVVENVYQRGVAGIPYSSDLWGHYATWKQNQGGSLEEVRGIFEQGLAYVGHDYLSHTLWDKYLACETSEGSPLTVAALYERILAIPLKELDRYYSSFQGFVSSKALEEIATEDEIANLKATVLAKLAESKVNGKAESQEGGQPDTETTAVPMDAEAAVETAPAADLMEDSELPPGAEEVPGTTDNTVEAAGKENEQPNAVQLVVTEEELKAEYVRYREQIYNSTKTELEKRKPFEDAIKRPYFHVKPLDANQVLNWSRYLDFIDQHGDVTSKMQLYERCLVPCAAYSEFWCRYVRLLESFDLERAREALQRATLVHCKRRPDIHLFAARFYERNNEVDTARQCYETVQQTLAPQLVQATVERANFEKRHGNKDAACEAYENHIKAEEEAKNWSVYNFLCIQYSNFLLSAFDDASKGREVLAQALAKEDIDKTLFEAAVHFETRAGGEGMVDRVLQLYDTASKPSDSEDTGLSLSEREEFASRAIAFADLYGDVDAIKRADAMYGQRFKLPISVLETSSRKRSAESQAAPSASKQHKADAVASAALPGAPAGASAAAAPNAALQPAAAAAAAASQAYYAQASAYYGQPAAYYGQYAGYGAYPAYGY